MDANEILKQRLGTHIEYGWDGKNTFRTTVLNDGDIKLTGDAYLSCRRVYTNKTLTEMRTVWVYRPHGNYDNCVKVAQKLAHRMIIESERNSRR